MQMNKAPIHPPKQRRNIFSPTFATTIASTLSILVHTWQTVPMDLNDGHLGKTKTDAVPPYTLFSHSFPVLPLLYLLRVRIPTISTVVVAPDAMMRGFGGNKYSILYDTIGEIWSVWISMLSKEKRGGLCKGVTHKRIDARCL
jgi:hypothetical protein